MALIGHWPLNGNTNDISGNGLHGTPTNITYSDGKIGQAASILNSGEKITISSVSGNILTYAAWHKWDTTSTTWRTIFGNNGNRHHLIFNNDRSVNIFDGSQRRFGYSCPDNNWHHYLVILENASNAKLYVDGEYKGQTTTTLDTFTHPIQVIGNWGSNSYPVGYLNDVRIYNHALTDFEIQELARAKILHYTFDNMQEPTTNKFLHFTEDELAPISGDGSPTNFGLDSNNTFRGLRPIKFQTGVSGNFYINGPARIATDVTSTQWTSSIYIKRVDGAAITSVGTYMYVTNNTNNNTNVNVEPVENGWYKVTRTRTGLTAGYPTLVGCYGLGAGVQYYIAMWQIEAKDHDTEYVKGSRTGKINDYSGFFNHSDPLTEANTPTWTPEAKIGTGAYKLNGNNYFLIHKYNASNDASLSLWFKSDLPTSTSQIVIGSPNSISFGIHNNTIIGMATTSSPVGLLSGSPYTVGQWNHIVITRDASNVMSYYINGIKISNGSNNNWGWNDDPYGIIGRRTLGNAGSTFYTNGEIDDVRIYKTVLSDKDIKDLYEARAEIEQSGVLYARDLLSNAEETVNLLSGQNVTFTSLTVNMSSQNLGNGKYRITSTSLKPSQVVGSFRMNMPTGILIDGLTYNLSLKYRIITGTDVYFSSSDWCDRPITRKSVNFGEYIFETAYGFRTSYDNTFRFMDYKLSPDTVIEIWDIQLEQRAGGTPFVSTYRPASQLPSTIQFAGNEVHETGTANFEDFSTVGITDGLVGYWQLNKDAKDYSGNNYHGTNNGALPYGEFYKFDGIDDFIDIPFEVLSTQSIRNSGLTMIAKIRPTTIKDSRYFSMKQSSGYSDSATGGLGMNGSGQPQMICYDDAGSYKRVTGSTNMTVNNWYIITGLYNPVDANIRLYVNGTEEGTPLTISLYSRLISNNETFIGKDLAETRTFAGDIDYVKVFNRALTPEEIAIEYNTMFNNEVQIHESGVLYAKDLRQY